MKKRVFITMALVCCMVICLAAMVDLAGKWSGRVKGPDGNDIPLTYIFKVDGDKLTGTAESNGNEVTIDSGRINGDEFKFSVTNTDGIVIPHNGKYYGDSVSMNLSFNGMKFHTTLLRDSK